MTSSAVWPGTAPRLLGQRASDLTSPAVHTCRADDSVRSAMATMTTSSVRHLPVVEHGELRGIISIGDVIKFYVDETDLEASVMRDDYLASARVLTAPRLRPRPHGSSHLGEFSRAGRGRPVSRHCQAPDHRVADTMSHAASY